MSAAGSVNARNGSIAGGWRSFGAAHGNFATNTTGGRGMSSFGTSRAGGSAFGDSTFGRGLDFGGNRFGVNGFGNRGLGFNNGFGFDRGIGFNRFGFGFRPFFGGGFGWGWGWGLGWGWDWGWGCGWGWPSWGWGCPGYWGLGWDYPGWGYPYANGYAPDGYDDSWIWDNNSGGNYSDYTGNANNNSSDNNLDYSNPPSNDEQGSQGTIEATPANGNDLESAPTVLYMKDGTAFQITSYWSSGNTLHYVNAQGTVSTVDVSQIDLQRTVDENAKHGVRFSVTPQPNTSPAITPKPAQPASSVPTVQATSETAKAA
jgi:hypothetical protein